MIITRTPFRISMFGGGTDYPAWFKRHGGAVLSTTIDKYCWLTVRWLSPFFGIKHRIVWSYIETVQSISEILHPCVRGCLQYLGFDDQRGLEIRHTGDLPARAGMGSSSSFSVGLIKALLSLREDEDVRPERLAEMAIELEQDVLNECVGCQDQIAAAYGGFNCIEFYPDGRFTVNPVRVEERTLYDLRRRLMLFYTGTTRLASQIAQSIVDNVQRRETTLNTMRQYVEDAKELLQCEDLDGFGDLMHRNWQLKRRLSDRVSNSRIDDIYQKAMNAGALGGKLLGAGAGGFMLFYVPMSKRVKVRDALDLLNVPFRFESEGCQIVYSG